MLYQRLNVDEETPVQFVGVYTTRWRPEWGEPTVMFREATDDELAECEAVKVLVAAAREISNALEANAAPMDVRAALSKVCMASIDAVLLLSLLDALAPFQEVTDVTS